MATKKKPRTPSHYTKQNLRLLDEYVVETGDDSGDLMRAAKWLHDNEKFDAPKYDPVKLIAKILATACRQDYFTNEKGEPVRRRHSYVVQNGDQRTFSWFKIEDATPEKMKLSANNRRNGTLMDILQLLRDVNYYNDHHNPGDPIKVETNFTPDVLEAMLPAEYEENPSDDALEE